MPVRSLVCFAIVFLLAFATCGSQAQASPNDDHFVSQEGGGESVLVAQTWSGRDSYEQSVSSNVRFRAKSVIKLALFVEAFIGGLIAFLVRTLSGFGGSGSNDGRLGASDPPPSEGPFASSAVVPGPAAALGSATASASAPPRLGQPTSKPTTSRPGLTMFWVFGSLIGIGAIALFGFAAVALWFVSMSRTVATPPTFDGAPFSAEQAEEFLAQVELVMDPAKAEFEKRWAEAVAENAAIAELDAQPETSSPPPRTIPDEATPIESPALNVSDLVSLGVSITHRGMSFDDVAPEGGVLVGFRVTGDEHKFQSIQPVCQVAKEYVLGLCMSRPHINAYHSCSPNRVIWSLPYVSM